MKKTKLAPNKSKNKIDGWKFDEMYLSLQLFEFNWERGMLENGRSIGYKTEKQRKPNWNLVATHLLKSLFQDFGPIFEVGFLGHFLSTFFSYFNLYLSLSCNAHCANGFDCCRVESILNFRLRCMIIYEFCHNFT